MTLRAQPYDDSVGGAVEDVLRWLSSMPWTAWVSFEVVEFTANVALFLPLGALAVLWGAPWWGAALVGLGVSGAIEGSQYLFLDTRIADPRDLVSNTLGALIGAVVVAALTRPRRSAPAT